MKVGAYALNTRHQHHCNNYCNKTLIYANNTYFSKWEAVNWRVFRQALRQTNCVFSWKSGRRSHLRGREIWSCDCVGRRRPGFQSDWQGYHETRGKLESRVRKHAGDARQTVGFGILRSQRSGADWDHRRQLHRQFQRRSVEMQVYWQQRDRLTFRYGSAESRTITNAFVDHNAYFMGLLNVIFCKY